MRKLVLCLVALSLIAMSGCVAPATYRNEYVSSNNPKAHYKQVALATEGYFADQLALSLKKSMASQGLVVGPADVTIRVSSRINIFSRKEGFFKRNARPLVTTLTAQAIRNSDQEVVYSLVKQYELLIDKKGNVVTNAWVDKATAELADELAKNLLTGA